MLCFQHSSTLLRWSYPHCIRWQLCRWRTHYLGKFHLAWFPPLQPTSCRSPGRHFQELLLTLQFCRDGRRRKIFSPSVVDDHYSCLFHCRKNRHKKRSLWCLHEVYSVGINSVLECMACTLYIQHAQPESGAHQYKCRLDKSGSHLSTISPQND